MASQQQRQKNLRDTTSAWTRFVVTWHNTVPGNRARVVKSAYYVTGKRAF